MFLLVTNNPVDGRVISDGIVHRVNTDDFEVFMSTILGHPVGVQHSQVANPSTHSFLSNTSEVPVRLKFIDSSIHWFAIDTTLGHWVLPTSSSYSHSVDHVALFGFVA